MTTILTDQGAVEVQTAPGDSDQLWLSAADTENISGWAMKPEGLCRGDICLPVPQENAENFVREGEINLAAYWRRMNKPLASSRDGETWALGEGAADHATRMQSLEAPDFSLPDLAGAEHRLSDYRGNKVFLATWASW